MKNKFSLDWQKSIRLMYHFFAITGIVCSFLIIVSWSNSTNNLIGSSKDQVEMVPDVNVGTENAKNFISNYAKRFVKGEAPPKGYFISRASLFWILENANLNGIYVYPAVNAQGQVCTIVEGGISGNASHNIIEGVEGRVVMSESPCPNDCGSLLR